MTNLELQLKDWNDLINLMSKIKKEKDKDKEKEYLKEFYSGIRLYNREYNIKFDHTKKPE